MGNNQATCGDDTCPPKPSCGYNRRTECPSGIVGGRTVFNSDGSVSRDPRFNGSLFEGGFGRGERIPYRVIPPKELKLGDWRFLRDSRPAEVPGLGVVQLFYERKGGVRSTQSMQYYGVIVVNPFRDATNIHRRPVYEVPSDQVKSLTYAVIRFKPTSDIPTEQVELKKDDGSVLRLSLNQFLTSREQGIADAAALLAKYYRRETLKYFVAGAPSSVTRGRRQPPPLQPEFENEDIVQSEVYDSEDDKNVEEEIIGSSFAYHDRLTEAGRIIDSLVRNRNINAAGYKMYQVAVDQQIFS